MKSLFTSESDRLEDYVRENNWPLRKLDNALLSATSRVRVGVLLEVRRRVFPDAPRAVWEVSKHEPVSLKKRTRPKRIIEEPKPHVAYDCGCGPSRQVTMKAYGGGSYAEFFYVKTMKGSKTRGFMPLKN